MITAFLLLLLAVEQPHPVEHQILSKTVAALTRFTPNTGVCGEEKVTIEKKEGAIVLLFDKEENQKDIDTTWTTLFFTKPHKEEKESIAIFRSLLKKLGIDATKSIVDVAWPGGPVVIVFGKNSHKENLPYLAVYRATHLPAELYTNGKKWRFTDYHKSVFPLAFPGNISHVDGEALHNVCSFIRQEFNQ